MMPYVMLMSLLLTFNKFHTFLGVSIVYFEQENAGYVSYKEKHLDHVTCDTSNLHCTWKHSMNQ